MVPGRSSQGALNKCAQNSNFCPPECQLAKPLPCYAVPMSIAPLRRRHLDFAQRRAKTAKLLCFLDALCLACFAALRETWSRRAWPLGLSRKLIAGEALRQDYH